MAFFLSILRFSPLSLFPVNRVHIGISCHERDNPIKPVSNGGAMIYVETCKKYQNPEGA